MNVRQKHNSCPDPKLSKAIELWKSEIETVPQTRDDIVIFSFVFFWSGQNSNESYILKSCQCAWAK